MVQVFSRKGKAVESAAVVETPDAKQDIKKDPSFVEPITRKREWGSWRQRRVATIGWGYVILMVLVFSLSSAWSLLLLVLNLEPNQSANFILQAEGLDNGHFWQSHKAPFSIQVTTTALLVVVVGVYTYLLYLLLIRPPSRRVSSEELEIKRQATMKPGQSDVNPSTSMRVIRRIARIVMDLFYGVVSTDGKHRKVWNVAMEIPEIVLQVMSLKEFMAQGLDPSLLYCYVSLMAMNAFLTFYYVQCRWNGAAMHHVLKDSILDATFAVFFPALVLFSSRYIFQDDFKTMKIRQRFFPSRAFERKARNFVSAKKLNMFSTTFESLLIRSGWDVLLKLSFSLLACARWTRITNVLLKREYQRYQTTRPSQSEGQSTGTMKKPKAVAPLDAEDSVGRQGEQIVKQEQLHRRRLRMATGLFFLMYGIGCIVFTTVAVQISSAACASYPQCVQSAYQWFPGKANNACGCLAYVDRDLAPAYAASFIDVTQTLARLASAGNLQTIQVVNRQINGSLPEELKKCQGLRNLILIHTGVESFPSWTSTSFSKLEYLHLEGDFSTTELTELPSNLFALMASLHTMHISHHALLPTIPSLAGLKALECLYFGYLDLITEVPSMDNLEAIQVIALESLPKVRVLPALDHSTDTLDLVYMQDTPACCSGFLNDGNCNTSFLSCCSSEGHSDNPLPSTCLVMPDEHALLPTNATRSVLSQFAANVSNFCDPAHAVRLNFSTTTRVSLLTDACAGVLYRKCFSTIQGIGICFSEDMGHVQCVHSQATIDMRRTEIAAGIKCDKDEEKWLGC